MYDLFPQVGCCFDMKEISITRKPEWLNKSRMADSLGISTQAFDKWGVPHVAKIGREAFYDMRSVLENRLAHQEQKHQPLGLDGEEIDPLIEYKLTLERLRLTAAQADGQEMKNMVTRKLMVPVPFATFALSKVIAQIASKLETVSKSVVRRHPEVDPVVVESFERELAAARNIAAAAGEQLPELLDEYVKSLAE